VAIFVKYDVYFYSVVCLLYILFSRAK